MPRTVTNTRTRRAAPAINPQRRLRAAFGLTQSDFAMLAGSSTSAIQSWEGGSEPTGPTLRKYQELGRLHRSLASVIDPTPAEIAKWLRTPNEAFGKQSPLAIIHDGQIDRIWRAIFQMSGDSPA